MGTNTDPYQRAEGRYRLMPGIIARSAAPGTPFSILTKGTLLGRDLPALAAAAARRAGRRRGVDRAARPDGCTAALEPGTPTPARPARPRAAHHATPGCRAGCSSRRCCPVLTDSDEALDALLGEIAAAGATGATRAGAAPAARHPRVVPRLAGPRAPGAGRAATPRLYRRGAYVAAGVPARAGRPGRPAAAPPRARRRRDAMGGAGTAGRAGGGRLARRRDAAPGRCPRRSSRRRRAAVAA